MKADPRTNIPDMNSMDIVWIQWFDDLKSNYGSKVAKSLWVMCWNKRGGKGAKANTTTLREKMDGNGIEIDSSFLGSVKDTTINTVNSITGYVGDIFSGTKTVLWVTCGVVVLFLGSIVYRNVKTGDATKILGAAIAPQTLLKK